MSLSGKIETTANVATIVVAVLISSVLVKTYLLPNPIVRQSAAVSAPEVIRGKSMDAHLLGVDWAKNHHTLVLAKLGAAGADVKMVAVLPQPVSESQQYLSSAAVHVDEVRQIPLGTLGVRATPTLLFVNDAGVVTDVWVGKLHPDQEAQVFATLGKMIAGLGPDHTILGGAL